MFLSGHINFKAPGLKKERFVMNPKNAGELIIDHREGPVPEVEDFDAWIYMVDDKEISIKTDADESEIINNLYLEIESKEGGKLSISISAKQAAALAGVLSRFNEVYSELQELKKIVRA